MDGAVGADGVVPVLTALVVDDQPEARRHVAALLELAGWQAHEAAGVREALSQAPALDPDLVVTDLLGGAGTALLRRLRVQGSEARFLVMADAATDEARSEAAAAGALACLAKPLGPRLLLDFLRSRTTGPTAQENLAQIHPTEIRPTEIHEVDDLHDDDVDADLMDRLQEMYVNALPGRLSAITTGARSGDTTALASAAHTLAGTSGQLGHPEVASVCRAIASDARRGILAHSRLMELRALAVLH
ncbi:MAG: Response regulator with CheY-like receiver domain and winged-helix DNA-binding domain [Frankiales bacterium]|nr:Response regulator with CheY-like receiver domain and winged-helix DNA-binding domain [Frankiales bacterium]